MPNINFVKSNIYANSKRVNFTNGRKFLCQESTEDIFGNIFEKMKKTNTSTKKHTFNKINKQDTITNIDEQNINSDNINDQLAKNLHKLKYDGYITVFDDG